MQHSFPNSRCFCYSIRKQNTGWIVDFPGWNTYCLSLMFTIFLNLLSTTRSLPQHQCVAQKFNTCEVITFQGSPFCLQICVIVLVLHSSGIPSLIASFSTPVIHIAPSSPSAFTTSIGRPKQSGPHALVFFTFLNCVMTS